MADKAIQYNTTHFTCSNLLLRANCRSFLTDKYFSTRNLMYLLFTIWNKLIDNWNKEYFLVKTKSEMEHPEICNAFLFSRHFSWWCKSVYVILKTSPTQPQARANLNCDNTGIRFSQGSLWKGITTILTTTENSTRTADKVHGSIQYLTHCGKFPIGCLLLLYVKPSGNKCHHGHQKTTETQIITREVLMMLYYGGLQQVYCGTRRNIASTHCQLQPPKDFCWSLSKKT